MPAIPLTLVLLNLFALSKRMLGDFFKEILKVDSGFKYAPGPGVSKNFGLKDFVDSEFVSFSLDAFAMSVFTLFCLS